MAALNTLPIGGDTGSMRSVTGAHVFYVTVYFIWRESKANLNQTVCRRTTGDCSFVVKRLKLSKTRRRAR